MSEMNGRHDSTVPLAERLKNRKCIPTEGEPWSVLPRDPDSLLNELIEQGNAHRERITLIEKQLADQQAYIENVINRLANVEKERDILRETYPMMVAMERKADRLRGNG